MSAMRALTERGLRIPVDVAIVGYDDVPLAAYTTPPLTTIRQDWAAGARILVERVLQPPSNRTADATVLSAELVVRGSSLRGHHQHQKRQTGLHKRGQGAPDRRPARARLRKS